MRAPKTSEFENQQCLYPQGYNHVRNSSYRAREHELSAEAASQEAPGRPLLNTHFTLIQPWMLVVCTLLQALSVPLLVLDPLMLRAGELASRCVGEET